MIAGLPCRFAFTRTASTFAGMSSIPLVHSWRRHSAPAKLASGVASR
ncbi:hypothetical protein BamIOP4010DRAFT_3230 [Burkholderia ambifaria IOP40-10]|uniref:Uncharacterized protein n=1 Tax=Burkholderia ambifaria IOP40-10 TaxID=396596 RepID=B1FGS0_9BURK|nr:hypothetical protein BamIOP4010DRAFT_3230 [Burkholderia ambifaria IOP40-10]